MPRLAVLAEVEFPADIDDFIRELDHHYQPARYPDLPSRGPSFHYDEAVAQKYLGRT